MFSNNTFRLNSNAEHPPKSKTIPSELKIRLNGLYGTGSGFYSRKAKAVLAFPGMHRETGTGLNLVSGKNR